MRIDWDCIVGESKSATVGDDVVLVALKVGLCRKCFGSYLLTGCRKQMGSLLDVVPPRRSLTGLERTGKIVHATPKLTY